MKSLSEITIIELADEYGAAALGVALSALQERWNAGLRDDETFIRLLFLRWYSISEPTTHNGLLESKLNWVEELINAKGNLNDFSPELKFIIATLSYNFFWCFGDDKKWENISPKLFEEVAKQDKSSNVFSNWRYLLELTDEINDLRKNIGPELHARFDGRGSMGSYLLNILGRRVGL